MSKDILNSTQTPQLQPAKNGLEAITLSTATGSSAQIYAYGAHVTSWVVAGKGEQLFVSEEALFAQGKAIRGGVPVIFPQFGALGPGGKHGFARTETWQLNAQQSHHQTVVFELQSNPRTLAAWPFAFTAQLQVTLTDDGLQLDFSVINTDAKTFAFTSALHSYFAVKELAETAVKGLSGCDYWDNGTPFTLRYRDNNPELRMTDALDRVYFEAAPQTLQLLQPQQNLTINSRGFADIVVWNPGREGAAALSDFAAAEFRHMLCIESAVVDKPIVLEPGASWTGSQLLRVE